MRAALENEFYALRADICRVQTVLAGAKYWTHEAALARAELAFLQRCVRVVLVRMRAL